MHPTPLAPPSLRERIGGRWAISLRLFGVTAVLMVLASVIPLTGLNALRVGAASADIAALALQLVVIGAGFLLLNFTLFRNRAVRPVPIWWVVGVGVFIGGVRIAAILGWAVSQGIAIDDPGRLVAGSIAVLAVSSLVPPVVAYLSATHAWYTEERERLVALAAEKEADRLRAVGALRDVALAAAQRDVESARAVLHDHDARPDQVAEALLLAARGGVRPAAHDLMRRPAPAAPRVSLREVLTSEFHRNPLPVVAPAIAFALITAPRAFVAIGVLAGLAIALVAAAGVVAVFPAFRPLIRRWPRAALPITLLACIVASLPASVLLVWAFDVQAPLAASIMTTVLLMVLVLAAGMVATAEDLGEEVLERLRIPVRESEIESLAADRARDALLREIGQHLHGTVQSGLVAASYSIRSAIETDDPAALDEALEAARRALERDVSPVSTSAPEVGDAGLVALAGEWDGLLDIDWHVDGLPPSAIGPVGEVVLECLANAVVHGHATRAVVRVVRGDDHISVQVEDDGTGPMAGPVGMGSMVLTRATAGDWAMAAGPDGGAVVTARVPVP